MRSLIVWLTGGVAAAVTPVLAGVPHSFFGKHRRAARFSSEIAAARHVTPNNRALLLLMPVIRGGDQEGGGGGGGEAATAAVVEQRELTLDEKVHAAMRKLGLQPPPPQSQPIDDDDDADAAASTTAATTAAHRSHLTMAAAAVATTTTTTTTSEEGAETASAVADNTNDAENGDGNADCDDGVCELPPPSVVEAIAATTSTTTTPPAKSPPEDPHAIASRVAQTMKVDLNMAWAALGATSVTATETNTRIFNEQAAVDMIQMELDMISQIQEDSPDVQQLVEEGHHDSFLVRRALAFAERNVEDARAILLADKMDEEEESAEAAKVEAQQQAAWAAEKKASEASFKTLNVAAGFDPTTTTAKLPSAAAAAAPEKQIPKAAPRDAVIFEATAAQVQALVLESPVPVLLDIYADWCGPCKALSPILEEMAVKGGGAFRLVKVNSDNERAISQALEVSALPTIFGFRDGKILHMFQGMPKSEEMMKNFLMGLLIPGQSFNPPVSASENQKYLELSTKLLKVAGSAGFSFSARESLQDGVARRLEELVVQTGDVFDAEQSATTLRALLSNIIRDPYDPKFRTINLSNKVIASKVAKYPACMAMLKSIGFVADGPNVTIGKGKRVVNVAPISVTREAIDKWIDKTRYEVARAARKRRDEADRVGIQAELAAAREAEEANAVEEAVEAVDPDECKLKLRVDGKQKVRDIVLHADDPLSLVLENIPGTFAKDGTEVQITCVAKRLVVKSTDSEAMRKSLREHGLMPNAVIVIKVMTEGSTDASASKLSERAAAKKKIKKGTHTMQSIGIYSKDDNAKGELIDGGGGTLYEQDVTDDEEETQQQNEVEGEEEQNNKGDAEEPSYVQDVDEVEDEETPSESIEHDE